MKKYIGLGLIGFVFVLSTFAIHSQTKDDISIIVRSSQGFQKSMKIGLHENATDSVDFDLGEDMFPGFGPGTEFEIFLLIKDIVGDLAYSNVDLRRYYSGEIEYLFEFQLVRRNPGVSIDFSWGSIPDTFDSAIMTDAIDEIDIFKVDMIEQNDFTLDNENITKVWIILKTNSAINSILNEDQIDQVNLYPNPATDFFIINEAEMITSIEIYDLAGILVKKVNKTIEKIDINDLAKGFYLVRMNYRSGNSQFKKLIIK